MLTVLVHIHVKEEFLEAFRTATIENSRNSLQEPGVVRFDVLQQQDDPTRWVLIETYRQPEDQLKHRETAHYARWRDSVADMMAEPRVGVKYTPVYPT
jgi:autoinducer 2-degrading protein